MDDFRDWEEERSKREEKRKSVKKESEGVREEGGREGESERSLVRLETVQVIPMYCEAPEGPLCGPWQGPSSRRAGGFHFSLRHPG